MGSSDSRLNFRKAVIELTSQKKAVEPADETFWEQFWAPEHVTSANEVFSLIPATEIRNLREDSPNNLATLCYKTVERLVQACEHGCHSPKEQQKVINCVRLLTRVLPYIFEDPDWRGYFWSALPADRPQQQQDASEPTAPSVPLAKALLGALCDLLFCPDFTVSSNRKGPETVDDLASLDSCEYIWQAGVGFAHNPPHHPQHDANRTEILKLLLTCFSEVIYIPPPADGQQPVYRNRWIEFVTSAENRHVLPLFTSLLNVICAYDPVGMGMPYNHLLFNDARGPLVYVALQLMITALDYDTSQVLVTATATATSPQQQSQQCGQDELAAGYNDNFFINYLSRVHRDEDFDFMLKGFTRLLNNPLTQTYLPNSQKRITFHQELLVLFWKCCEYNKKFLYHVLKSSDVLDILVPILFHLNDSRNDQSRVGLIHMGVFILLLLSGERNFGVRLNKPYTVRVPMDIPIFTGNHADLLIIVFHKLITTGNQRLQSLFDCLLTIIVNVSPYLKSLSMVAANKLVHLLEAFSTPWFLFSAPNNHHLVFFLLEVFNNIIQYQFDGNSNLVYTIIRKRQVFYQLANLPTDHATIAKSLATRKAAKAAATRAEPPPEQKNAIKSVKDDMANLPTQEGAPVAEEAKPGTLQTSLPEMPVTLNEKWKLSLEVRRMTEKSQSHLQSTTSEQSGSATETNATKTTNNDKQTTTTNAEGRQEHASPTTHQPHSDPFVAEQWTPNPEWVQNWKAKLPLQTIMRLLQVLVPQVEKICIDKGLTDETEILKFLQHGTLVGLLPVPHPILIRKYQANAGTNQWFRTYMWGVIYLRNTDPPIWYDTDVKLFEIQRI